MRLGTVVGRVTLSVRHPRLSGERLLLTMPWNADTYAGKEEYDFSIVVFDHLGAGVDQTIAISEGREAASPFPNPTPVDAYCAALVDEIFYQESPGSPTRHSKV